jgi:catechol 2,3-dioxygenase-like lactoylglutathione lyase family enzyme
MSIISDVPSLDGIHHVKLPVADLDRTAEWYSSRLGYRLLIRFTKRGRDTGLVMGHPDGGPMLSFVHDPDRAARVAGFDYFSIGVRDKEALEAISARLAAFDDANAGIHFATIGWILPDTHDPDGHEVRFYTNDHHTVPANGQVLVVEDPIGSEDERHQTWAEQRR